MGGTYKFTILLLLINFKTYKKSRLSHRANLELSGNIKTSNCILLLVGARYNVAVFFPFIALNHLFVSIPAHHLIRNAQKSDF